ncbi:MAG: hypothetical protein IMZ57_00455, partial [Acidobacteria bacterium]|nr:hypothetical protein [Acidobacteriota bacterium]
MKRAIQAGLAVVFLALVGLALFLGRTGREAENRIDLSSQPSSATAFWA